MADAPQWLSQATGEQSGLSGADLKQLATNSSQMLVQMGNLIQALTGLLPFSGATGTFTCGAAATTTVNSWPESANSAAQRGGGNADGVGQEPLRLDADGGDVVCGRDRVGCGCSRN